MEESTHRAWPRKGEAKGGGRKHPDGADEKRLARCEQARGGGGGLNTRCSQVARSPWGMAANIRIEL